MSKFETKYQAEFKESGHTDFTQFMIAKYELIEYSMEQEREWSGDLEHLLMDIFKSGLLKETQFEQQLKDIYRTLDV